MSKHIEYETTGKPHPYHLVKPSIWPLISSLAGGLLALGAIFFMHDVSFEGVEIGWKGLILGFLAVILGTLNVVGGFVVTDRMLEMFKKKKEPKTP